LHVPHNLSVMQSSQFDKSSPGRISFTHGKKHDKLSSFSLSRVYDCLP